MKNKNTLEQRLQDLEQKVENLEKKLSGNSTTPSAHLNSGKTLSEKEYLLGKKPTDDVQRAFYLGRYLEEYKRMESFTAEDLRNAFRVAREPVPSNINDKINKNVAKGYFMEVDPKDDKKAWVLTSTGEKVISDKIGEN